MRRVVSVCLPSFPAERLRRSGAAPADLPLVTRLHDGRRTVVAAADPAAAALGLRPGMALAQAQAMVPNLVVAEADPAGDAAALARLAGWCLRFTPLTAPDADGLWLDITGCAHLHGGEAGLLHALVSRMARDGFTAVAAVADTPGAAHAAARHRGPAVVPPGAAEACLAPLPVAALRLDPDSLATLRRMGLDRIGQLAALPRGPLSRRLGPAVLRRLDQALGRVAEPITPTVPPDTPASHLRFAEPLLAAESLSAAIGRLCADLCGTLERRGEGVRLLDLLFDRVDGSVATIRIGTARPNRDPCHLARLLDERLDGVDPGLGVDAMHLVASRVDPLRYAQAASLVADEAPDLSGLVDRLANRLGAGRVWRVAAADSDVPERSVRRVAAVAPATGATWPAWPRPARLLCPPQRVEMTYGFPDQPPAAFTWRRHHHRVRRADGPERITGEWWRRDAERSAVRDYWQVEDESGRRFWLFRRGDGHDPATGALDWFVHGVF